MRNKSNWSWIKDVKDRPIKVPLGKLYVSRGAMIRFGSRQIVKRIVQDILYSNEDLNPEMVGVSLIGVEVNGTDVALEVNYRDKELLFLLLDEGCEKIEMTYRQLLEFHEANKGS